MKLMVQLLEIVGLAMLVVLLGLAVARGGERVCPTCDVRTVYYIVGILIGLLWKYVPSGCS